MPNRFEVTLHANGLSVPIDGEGHAKGFYAIRRARASTVDDAVERAISALKQEEKYQSLLHATAKENGRFPETLIEPECVTRVSWLRWHFTRKPSSYIFYADEKSD